MKARLLIIFCIIFSSVYAQGILPNKKAQDIPNDLPIPTIMLSNHPSEGYIFASVPYWGNGNNYLVIYDDSGKPVFFRKTKSTCTDFKLHSTGLITYFDYSTKKFYAMDSTMAIVDSFWVKNGYNTDEHDIKFLKNGNVLLIGLDYKLVDMSLLLSGGSKNASVVVNVIQEIDKNKNIVFEWKSFEHYKYTDAGEAVNLLDQAFVHSHINSVDVDLDDNLIISSRNLDEITKVDRKTGKIIWRFGGKNNQFVLLNDSVRFSAQHSVSVLSNGNLLVYDNGVYNSPPNARAVEYKLDEITKTASVVWSYTNSPTLQSKFWGNVQRLKNGNTFISWGLNEIAATEVTSSGTKIFEMKLPKDVYSYRIFRFPFKLNAVSVGNVNELPLGFSLKPNYPNPFNPSTQILYQLSKKTKVELKVYDLLGKVVAILVDEEKEAGTHSVVFNAKNLSSGSYFYQLRSAIYIQTQKMLLLK